MAGDIKPQSPSRAASNSPPRASLRRNAGVSRRILAMAAPLPHECGVPFVTPRNGHAFREFAFNQAA